MPLCKCDECGEEKYLTKGEKASLHSKLDFLCSKECILSRLQHTNGKLINKMKVFHVDHSDFDRDIWSEELETNFASYYEMQVAEWLTENGFEILYEPFTIDLFDGAVYTPDFYVLKRNVIVEVKGKWRLGQRKKISMFVSLYPDAEVILIPWYLHNEFFEGEENGRNSDYSTAENYIS